MPKANDALGYSPYSNATPGKVSMAVGGGASASPAVDRRSSKIFNRVGRNLLGPLGGSSSVKEINDYQMPQVEGQMNPNTNRQ